jgi:hypothetical protein
MYWDDAPPCVEAPIGDFFGIDHSIIKNFARAPAMSGKWAVFALVPDAIRQRARIEVTNGRSA